MFAITIDSEEWNCPLLYGKDVSENGLSSLSRAGNEIVLHLLERYGIKATFFITGRFAEMEPEQVRFISSSGHEIACHGYEHRYLNNPSLNIIRDIRMAKRVIEGITGQEIHGFRAPQMQFSEELLEILESQGFAYDSSLHPAFVPGRYNNFRMPVGVFRPLQGGKIVEIPVVVSHLRLPVSWACMRLFGKWRTVVAFKQYFIKGLFPVLYVHSWEFVRIRSSHVPFYYTFKTGEPFIKTFDAFLHVLKHLKSCTMYELIRNV